MIVVNVANHAHSSQTISIGSQEIRLEFRWNDISSQWSVDIDVDEVSYLKGCPLAPNRFTTRPYISLTKVIKGEFACLRITEEVTPLNRESFAKGSYVFGFIASEE
tara:strand:- start:31765 stop:32082 length:318 start_codon:yes stop_codon:yes gene_type:complete